ncbi:response regulator transcription factor [Polaribacter sp. Hel_I_88]|uniref:response regulator transcription factor n=1 Tax=Polaribacter sp. Hel_I_88 TaxID=1250006 RepID=UPI00068BC447|nr:response regulator transcription factor [Polaribacter sp. Hel_I_88]
MSENKKHILIVEDEILIASQIKMALIKHGFECAGIAINYSSAEAILKTAAVDLVLIDITLSGNKTGLDLAEYLNINYRIPFLFITSYNDKTTLEKIKNLSPSGYINKPINEATLLTTLDIIFNSEKTKETKQILVNIGNSSYNIHLSELLYVEAEHVYIKLRFKTYETIIRCSLTSFLKLLPEKSLIQISRGTAINPAFINKIESSKVIIADKKLKLSKNYSENLKEFM